MAHVDYNGRMAAVYDRGRRLPPATTQHWVEAVARHIPAGDEPVLDLGAGTGRFLRPLAEGLGADLIGLEPAAGMRAKAARHIGPGISVVAGTASKLPFRSSAIRGVWASQVLHHVADLEGCAQEVRRVLVPGGCLLVRGMYDDLIRQWPLVRYFPGVLSVAHRFSSLDEMRRAICGAGLREVVHQRVEQIVAEDSASFYERTAVRADSGLALLPDDEFESGLAMLRTEVENGRCVGPISEVLDLVVFRNG